MHSIVIVNNKKDWPFNIPGVEVVSAKSYLMESCFSELQNLRVFNLCRSYKYQSIGYYISLLADARGHRVFPNTTAIQDLKSQTLMRIITDDVDELIQQYLSKLKSKEFILDVYFGYSLAKQYEKLARNLHELFKTPTLRAHFVHNKKWVLQDISPIPLNDIPEAHKPYIEDFAKLYFPKKRIKYAKINQSLYDLAILVNPSEVAPPSNKKAIQRFIDAAEELNFSTEIITKDDFSRLPEFDALFIRETTAVNHHTYRFARRAHAEGLVVIDDPISIMKCANKVYLCELLTKAKIRTPKTMIIHKDNKSIARELGLPCILKQPDGSFSKGMAKIEDEKTLLQQIDLFLSRSDLIIAQEFTPTKFDWRIGILDRKPLYACKYYMAKNHWQVYNWNGKKGREDGDDEAIPLDKVPKKVIDTALKAAKLIGDGFYGVDLKEYSDRVLIIEINDNPSIDHGIEDGILKDELYMMIMSSILNRLEHKRQEKNIRL